MSTANTVVPVGIARKINMKKILLVGLSIIFLMPVLTMAQSDFDGTWKIDVSKTIVSAKTDTFVLKSGTYQCKTCLPAINVKADGEDHSVNKNPYYDAISVKVSSDQGIETTEKQKGKTVAISRMTVSPDGVTATVEYSGNANSDPVTYKEIMTRLGKTTPAAGSHAISGPGEPRRWKVSRIRALCSR
jgi:hypothetical protein